MVVSCQPGRCTTLQVKAHLILHQHRQNATSQTCPPLQPALHCRVQHQHVDCIHQAHGKVGEGAGARGVKMLNGYETAGELGLGLVGRSWKKGKNRKHTIKIKLFCPANHNNQSKINTNVSICLLLELCVQVCFLIILL